MECPPYTKKLFTEKVNKGRITDCDYSPDGRYLATCSSKKEINLFFSKTGELLRSFGLKPKETAHKSTIYGCSFNPTGTRLATCSGDKTVKIWSLPETDETMREG